MYYPHVYKKGIICSLFVLLNNTGNKFYSKEFIDDNNDNRTNARFTSQWVLIKTGPETTVMEMEDDSDRESASKWIGTERF